MDIDLHGYHPDQIDAEMLQNIVRQAWEIGVPLLMPSMVTVAVEAFHPVS